MLKLMALPNFLPFFIHMHTYTHMHMHTHTCTCNYYTHAHTHTHTHTHMHRHRHTHTHTHTYMHIRVHVVSGDCTPEWCVEMTDERLTGLRQNLLQSYITDPISDETFFAGCSGKELVRQ